MWISKTHLGIYNFFVYLQKHYHIFQKDIFLGKWRKHAKHALKP